MVSGSKGSAPLRILHVTPSFFPAHGYGGPVTALYELCRAQLRAGHEVRVLTSDADGKNRLHNLSGRWVKDYGVPTYYGRVSAGEDISLELLLRLPGLLGWADIVHVTGLFSATSLLGMLAAAGARRPFVVSPRGALLPWALSQGSRHKKRALAVLSPLLRKTAGWHATSDEEAAAIKNLFGAHAIVSVVPNGIAEAPILSVFTDAKAGPKIVVLGRVHPVKNLELAVESLAALRKVEGCAQATLTVIGPEDKNYGERLRELANSLGILDSVHFLGLLTGEAKQRVLVESDVLWLCSHMESFGNVVLEALAAGTPVVAAKTTPWKVLAELGGRWVSPTVNDFVTATRSLLAEQATQDSRMAVKSRLSDAVLARFSWSRVEPALRFLYQRALGG